MHVFECMIIIIGITLQKRESRKYFYFTDILDLEFVFWLLLQKNISALCPLDLFRFLAELIIPWQIRDVGAILILMSMIVFVNCSEKFLFDFYFSLLLIQSKQICILYIIQGLKFRRIINYMHINCQGVHPDFGRLK